MNDYADMAMDWYRGTVEPWLTTTGLEVAWKLLTALLILLAGWCAIKFIDKMLRRAFDKMGKKLLLANFVASVTAKACWAVLLVMVLSRLGVDVAPLVAGLGVTGFIVGFACQESLSNLAAGVMIAINEPFKVGDFVDASGHAGKIVEVSMMATVMTTADNKKIVLPNKSVWGGPITNFSAMDTRRVDLQVGVAYKEDAARAVDVILDAVRSVPGVLSDAGHAPGVSVAALGESQVTINVRPWCRNSDYWAVYSATLQAVKRELEKAGIEIPFPQMVVHNA
ncbi:MAG: mechanosensitive ion channel family protein [Kiritimatiellae bacterium]|nr:mechanosensitive ion channel family protein [Kiritimatiellia bacterium]